MKNLTDYVVSYVRYVYGAQVIYRNRAVYIKTEDYTYRVDFCLAHKGIYRFVAIQAPLVLTETCLARGFFRVAAHATYKLANKIPTNSDWESFLNEAYKNGVYLEV